MPNEWKYAKNATQRKIQKTTEKEKKKQENVMNVNNCNAPKYKQYSSSFRGIFVLIKKEKRPKLDAILLDQRHSLSYILYYWNPILYYWNPISKEPHRNSNV